LIACFRCNWVLQESADYHRRVFDAPLGAQPRHEAFACFVDRFGPEDVSAAYRADREIASG
jgi:hypothetical protein